MKKLLCTQIVVLLFCFSSQAFANPITIENAQLGTKDWVLSMDGSGHEATDKVGQIKGYLSATSVNKGGSIDFKVSVNRPQNFTIEIYRAGYYQGQGGRLITTIGPIAGITQPACARDNSTGLVECNWSTSYTLTIPSDWTSGIFLAKFKNSDGFDSGAIFVVRDDSRTADLLYQQPVATYQAYNQYPEGVNGSSVYTGDLSGLPKAVKVSFNRPYAGYRTNFNGYGHFLEEEINLVKWLEKEGYDMAYSTDVDADRNGSQLLHYRGILYGGHGEYWSKAMRDAAENAKANKVNLAFFGANDAYWQVRLEPDSRGNAQRTLVCYKSDSDPISDDRLKTNLFRSGSVNRPEQSLLGIQYISYKSFWNPSTFTDLIIKNGSHWAFEGSGLINNQHIPKIVGYEIDNIQNTYPLALNSEFTILAESPFVNAEGNNLLQHSVIYRGLSSSGDELGWVFSSGTMAWSWALDYESSLTPFGRPFGVDLTHPGLQRVTKNILDRFVREDTNANHPPTGQPVITGIAQNDQTLTVDTSSINDADGLGEFSYQWQRDGSSIAGAIASNYRLTASDVGKQIRVVISYLDGLGYSESLASAQVTVTDNVSNFLGIKSLKNIASNRCANASSSSNNLQIIQSSCNGANSRKWNIEQIDSTSFRVTNQASNKVLAVRNNSTSNNAVVIQQTLNNSSVSQLWNIQLSSSNSYNLINKNSGRCLSITTTASGTGLVQRSCSNNYQRWRLN